MGEIETKASMGERAGRLRVTLDMEINEELLTTVKDSIASMSEKLPEAVSNASNMMRRGERSRQGGQ